MDRIYVFIIRNDIWIYIVAGLGLFWYFSELIRSQRILRQAVFGLEQETGTRIRNNALLFIAVLTAVIGIVYYVNNYVAPTLPASLFRPPTPTPDIFRTPLASPTALNTPLPSPTPPLVPTITLVGDPGVVDPNAANTAVPADTSTAESGTPTPVPTPLVACTLELNFSNPRDGGIMQGTVTFNGTANLENQASYRVEANGPQTTGQWASLLGRDVDQRVEDNFLGNANLSQWESGPYLLRLTAVDANNNDIAHCVIQVTLEN